MRYAGVVELADTQDLGSCAKAYGFKSLHLHHQYTRERSVRNSAACVFSIQKCPISSVFRAEYLTILDLYLKCDIINS